MIAMCAGPFILEVADVEIREEDGALRNPPKLFLAEHKVPITWSEAEALDWVAFAELMRRMFDHRKEAAFF